MMGGMRRSVRLRRRFLNRFWRNTRAEELGGLLLMIFLFIGILLSADELRERKSESMRWYKVVISQETVNRVNEYLERLKNGEKTGSRLQNVLAGKDPARLGLELFLEHLTATKIPQIFAEKEVCGDGTDWNQTELSLLGDISVVVPVTVFDNGLHARPMVHPKPFSATLLFVPGALLQNGRGQTPADWDEVTREGKIDHDRFARLYERRLMPVLLYAHEAAGKNGKKAVVTVPGLGCGQFAGPFRGMLGQELRIVLRTILERHGKKLSNIACLYYDSYSECRNERESIHGISFFTRPLSQGNQGRPQLCRPEAYAEDGDDFSGCELFSVVAWDHVSWPGNDFYGGSRATDDGVKAAATDAMTVLTGVQGSYDSQKTQYQPPSPFRTWNEVVIGKKLRLEVVDRLVVYPR